VGARVISRDENKLIADLTIGFKMFRESFRSEVTLDAPRQVRVTYLNGPFRYLNNTWTFTPVEGGTEVAFFVDFEFRSRMLQMVIGTVFNEACASWSAPSSARHGALRSQPTRDGAARAAPQA
jgi:coenzyme Q-binding protein COQ10